MVSPEAVVATENDDGFRAYVEVIDAPEWHGASLGRLRAAVPQHADGASVLFAADQATLASEEFPVVVIDLEQGRPEFRCIAAELWSVENNRNISNMDWEEFAGSIDADGIFRGFSDAQPPAQDS